MLFKVSAALSAVPDTTGVQALIDSCNKYVFRDNQKASKAIQTLMTFSEKVGFEEGIIRGHVFQGGVWWSVMEWDAALESYQKAMEIAQQNDFGDLFVLSCGNVGLIYQNINMPDSAMLFFQKAHQKAVEIGSPTRQIHQLVNIGYLHKNLGNYPQAALDFTEALKIGQELNDHGLLASVYGALGLLYSLVGDETLALSNLKRAASFYEESRDYMVLYTVYSNILSVYSDAQPDRDSALYYAEKAREIVPDSRAALLEYTTYVNLGVLYQKIGQHDSAFVFFKNAYLHPMNKILSRERITVLTNFGAHYLKKGVADSATFYLEDALEGADSLQIADLQMGILYNLIQLQEVNELCSQTGILYKRLLAARDNRKVHETKQIIAKKEIEAELLKSAHNFEVLSLENESQRRQLSNKSLRLRLISVFSLLVVGLSVVLGVQNRMKHQALTKLTSKNKEIADLFIQNPVFQKVERGEEEGGNAESEWMLLAKRLDRLVRKDKIHLDSQLTVEDLAGKMGITRQHCSMFLSNFLNMNFSEFLNRQRVFEAQQLLHDERYANHTMAAIGEMCGFQSARTFFHVFKSITGLTPAFYKEQKSVR